MQPWHFSGASPIERWTLRNWLRAWISTGNCEFSIIVAAELPKIALGWTLLEEMPTFVAFRWMELLRSYYWPGPLLNGRKSYPAQARNYVVDGFFQRDRFPLPVDDWKSGGLEALLFWDDDQLPPMVIPQRDGSVKLFTRHLQDLLVENPDKGVIPGLYFSRETEFHHDVNGNIDEFPHSPLAYERVENARTGWAYRTLPHERMLEILSLDGRYRLHKVDGAGTGAMLIRKSVLERLAAAKPGRGVFENPDLNDGRSWTEDLYFCHQIQTLLDPPVEIWLDSAGESAHQGDRIWIRSQHYLAAHGQIGLNSDSARALENAAREAVSDARGRIILPDGWQRN